MAEPFLDTVARCLAEPMTRKRALWLMGVALGALTGPVLRAPPAHGCPTRCSPTEPKLCNCHVRREPGNPVEICNHLCCPPDYTCSCPPGAARCDPPANRCKNAEEDKCGAKCCPDDSFCCNQVTGDCCNNKSQSCCPVGAGDSAIPTCCSPQENCGQLSAPGGGGMVEGNAPRLCCPPARYVPSWGTCCAEGEVSITKVLVGFRASGSCCSQAKVCGSGASRTCCQTYPEGWPKDRNEICCNGECISPFAMLSDVNNCGSCGNVCPQDPKNHIWYICEKGVCVQCKKGVANGVCI